MPDLDLADRPFQACLSHKPARVRKEVDTGKREATLFTLGSVDLGCHGRTRTRAHHGCHGLGSIPRWRRIQGEEKKGRKKKKEKKKKGAPSYTVLLERGDSRGSDDEGPYNGRGKRQRTSQRERHGQTRASECSSHTTALLKKKKKKKGQQKRTEKKKEKKKKEEKKRQTTRVAPNQDAGVDVDAKELTGYQQW